MRDLLMVLEKESPTDGRYPTHAGDKAPIDSFAQDEQTFNVIRNTVRAFRPILFD